MIFFSDKRTELQGAQELAQGHKPRLLSPCPVLIPVYLSAFPGMFLLPGQESSSPSDMARMVEHCARSGLWSHGRHTPTSLEPIKV